MKPALLLVDLQRDYLAAPGLEPAAGVVATGAARLLEACRAKSVPVVHVWTTIDREPDLRMAHWREQGRWQCVRGTEGHRPPPQLEPRPDEAVFHKCGFNAFGAAGFEHHLRSIGADTLVVAGVHLHACVRTAALEAYERGFGVWIAEDAVASDDPLHASITRRYLSDRSVRFRPVWEIECELDGPGSGELRPAAAVPTLAVSTLGGVDHPGCSRRFIHRCSPADDAVQLASIPVGTAAEVAACVEAARRVWTDWAIRSPAERAAVLARVADQFLKVDDWAREIARETGKPIRHAREEVAATEAQFRALSRRAMLVGDLEVSPGVRSRRCPLGVVAVITPWNNPLYIPAGKIGAALAHGNAVVWKPAPAGSTLAFRLVHAFVDSGLPVNAVGVVLGDASTARRLMSHPGIDGVTLTGSAAAGWAAQELCARRHLPLQAELGGNNAAIIWSDAVLADAAARIAEGAFAMAGQRCTANRRVIVERSCLEEFIGRLVASAAAIPMGDPMEPATRIGPMISAAERDRVAGAVARARVRGVRIIEPLGGLETIPALPGTGAYHPPIVAVCEDSMDELVQEESFGPVLVIQPAADWEQALRLCNGVRQGLAAALFTSDPGRQEQFLREARAGILKLGQSTAGADVDVPFGGWKSSGFGPAEHGDTDLEFHTRVQAIYR